MVNLATALPSTATFVFAAAWRRNAWLRTHGSAALVDAAVHAGVGRFVQESVALVYRDNGSAWIDESWPTQAYPLARSNLAAEDSAERFTANGGAGVVLRFGWFYGPGARRSEQFLELARRTHVCVMLGRPEGYVSSIHVADAGAAVAAALTVPAGTYNVVDDEPLTKRAYADALARAAGVRARIRLPGPAALLLGNRTTSPTRSLRVSNAAFRHASGWRPTYPNASVGLEAMGRR